MKTSSSWLCKLKCRGEAKLAWLVCLGWVAPRFLLKIWRISSHWKYHGFLPIGNIKNVFLLAIVRISSWKYWGFLPNGNIEDFFPLKILRIWPGAGAGERGGEGGGIKSVSGLLAVGCGLGLWARAVGWGCGLGSVYLYIVVLLYQLFFILLFIY